MSHPARIALLALFLAAYAAFGWWSWTAVRRRTAGGGALPAARHGLGLWGLMMLVALSLDQSLYRVDATLADAVRMPSFWRQLPLQLFIMFPLCLWGNYFFYRLLGAGLGLRTPLRK
jgi:hypothetical protein